METPAYSLAGVLFFNRVNPVPPLTPRTLPPVDLFYLAPSSLPDFPHLCPPRGEHHHVTYTTSYGTLQHLRCLLGIDRCVAPGSVDLKALVQALEPLVPAQPGLLATLPIDRPRLSLRCSRTRVSETACFPCFFRGNWLFFSHAIACRAPFPLV